MLRIARVPKHTFLRPDPPRLVWSSIDCNSGCPSRKRSDWTKCTRITNHGLWVRKDKRSRGPLLGESRLLRQSLGHYERTVADFHKVEQNPRKKLQYAYPVLEDDQSVIFSHRIKRWNFLWMGLKCKLGHDALSPHFASDSVVSSWQNAYFSCRQRDPSAWNRQLPSATSRPDQTRQIASRFKDYSTRSNADAIRTQPNRRCRR